jgi:HAD superfamily hydrolase (TIGR01450 family)
MGWVLDLDGVVWLADSPIAGAAEAVARLREAGEQVLFATNNSGWPVGDVEAKLASHGIPAEGEVITSAMAAAALVEPGERALLCAGAGAAEALEARGAVVVHDGPADVVVVGFHTTFDYAGLTRASTAVRGGARLLATNADLTYPTPEGPVPGGGAILAAVAAASGVEPVVAGKPFSPMADLVRVRLGASGTMVGDRPSTDGAFARTLGYRFLLVHSGVAATEGAPDPVPDEEHADLLTAVLAHHRGAAPGPARPDGVART